MCTPHRKGWRAPLQLENADDLDDEIEEIIEKFEAGASRTKFYHQVLAV